MYTQMRVNQPNAPEDPIQTNQSAEPPDGASPGQTVDAENSGMAALPVVSADPGKTQAEIEQMVKNLAASAEKYRAAYSETNEFVSRSGYLYDYPADMYISVKDLTDVEGFNSAYADEEAMILYVKAGDMPQEITSGMDADKLTVFAAYPSEEDFIASNGSSAVIVEGSVIQDLLNRYSADHGQIIRVSSQSETFAAVMRALGDIPALDGSVDVRYMSEDEKYISAVVSPHSDYNRIMEFVLLKTDGECELLIEQIETEWQKFVAINTDAPDLNLELIPAYNLWRDMKDLKTDFTALLDSMVTSGIIAQDEGEPVFISGNGEFVFMEFEDGMRMLAHFDDTHNEWKVYQVLQYDDAVARMKELAKFNPPPYFLIKQA
jgi:hypothetical protein